VDGARFVEQRLHHAPGLLDRALAGEELVLAVERVAEQALVGLGVLTLDPLEQDLQVGGLEGLLARFLRVEADPRPRFGLDPDRQLVRFRRLAGADAEPWRAMRMTR